MRSFTLIFFILVPCFLQAQALQSESLNINVSAEIVSTIELIIVNSINFTDVEAVEGNLTVNPIDNISAGFFIAKGNPGSEFKIDYIPVYEINRTGGPGTLTIEYKISVNPIEEQRSSTLIDFNEGTTFRFNSEGKYYIWVGGTTNIENTPPGKYDVNFTLELDYI